MKNKTIEELLDLFRGRLQKAVSEELKDALLYSIKAIKIEKEIIRRFEEKDKIIERLAKTVMHYYGSCPSEEHPCSLKKKCYKCWIEHATDKARGE